MLLVTFVFFFPLWVVSVSVKKSLRVRIKHLLKKDKRRGEGGIKDINNSIFFSGMCKKTEQLTQEQKLMAIK